MSRGTPTQAIKFALTIARTHEGSAIEFLQVWLNDPTLMPAYGSMVSDEDVMAWMNYEHMMFVDFCKANPDPHTVVERSAAGFEANRNAIQPDAPICSNPVTEKPS